MPQPTNDLVRTFETGGVALGVLDDAYSPTLVELYGECGLDFVWIDLEHGGPSPLDGPAITALLRATERVDTELVCRLPNTDPTLLRKALDLGLRSVFLPRVEGPEPVRQAVRSSRFAYGDGPGDRGLAAPRASRWGTAENYRDTEDRETTVGVTIETAASVAAIEDILAVEELGFVFVGPYDLSVSLGHPGEVDHPEVQAAVETVREAAVAADVPLGGLSFGPEDRARKVEHGYQMLHLGSTTGALRGAAADWLAADD
jgi:2-dehydro-3-deoxyglucarate aldolase